VILAKLLTGNSKYILCGIVALLAIASPGHATPPTKTTSVVVEKQLSGGTQDVVDKVMSFLPEAREAHEAYPDVPVSVILTVIHIESGGEPTKVNKVSKAAGLMQIVPGPHGAYFKAFGLTSETALDPASSILAGTEILHAHMIACKKRWGGSLKYVLAAYNRGAGNIDGSYPSLDATALGYLKMYNKVAPLYKDIE